MTAHLDSLRSFLEQTPARSAEAETRVATAVSKLLTVLAGERKSDLVEEARSEVYLDVLDDVPCWAVEAGSRRWFMHDCGTDERGKPYDYRWTPDPGTLRRIAYGQMWPVHQRIRELEQVLSAQGYVDCSRQLADGQAAMRGLKMHRQQNATDQKLTFVEAVALGNQLDKEPALSAAAE
jgi:hypothetical protein